MDKIIIYNPRDGSEINETYAQSKWKHEVNTIKKYEFPLGRYLLKKYGFLVEIQPTEIPKYKKLTESIYVCQDCDFVTNTSESLLGHLAAKHKLTNDIIGQYKELDEAVPVGEVRPVKASPESVEGLPDTSKGEKQGWYGGGLENDTVESGMISKNIPGETPGQF